MTLIQQNVELPFVRYRSTASDELADWISIDHDLKAVVAICARLDPLLNSVDSDPVLIDALWAAAIVRYGRCFGTGKRRSLDTRPIEHLNGDPLGAHGLYKNLRDKLVAHSVNSYEEVQVGLLLRGSESGEFSMSGLGHAYFRAVATEVEGVRQLAMLARDFGAHVESQIAAATAKVEFEAKALRAEDLAKLRPIEYVGPSAEAAGRSRR